MRSEAAVARGVRIAVVVRVLVGDAMGRHPEDRPALEREGAEDRRGWVEGRRGAGAAGRGLRVAVGAEETFGSFVALGRTTMMAVPAFVNMSVVLGLMPTKGIPLPLMSFGGSSLLMNLLGMGVLLNISQHESAEA